MCTPYYRLICGGVEIYKLYGRTIVVVGHTIAVLKYPQSDPLHIVNLLSYSITPNHGENLRTAWSNFWLHLTISSNTYYVTLNEGLIRAIAGIQDWTDNKKSTLFDVRTLEINFLNIFMEVTGQNY